MFPIGWTGPSLRHGQNMGGVQLPKRTTRKPIVGFRSWFITGHPRLKSIHVDYLWAVDNTAACLGAYKHADPAPSPKCACGLYAQTMDRPLDEWEKTTRGRIRASGMVAMSGRVIVCEYGYKAERALIQSPLVLELECGRNASGECWEPVTGIEPANPYAPSLAFCTDHADGELTGTKTWLDNTMPLLEAAYPGIEFLIL